MPQNINLNIPPYNDDFDAKKNYHKVLFKPDENIQSRELTTLQSILQNQIEKFGQHFFKEGSIVIPGSIGYDPEYSCVEINPVHLGIPVTEYLDSLVGVTIKGETSNIVAKIENVITDKVSDRNNCTLYIKYKGSSSTDFTTNKFIDGESLITLSDISYSLGAIRENNSFATTIGANCTSVGSAVKITEGVFFLRGYFITVPSQTVILDQYSNTPSYRVGLLIKEYFASASNEYSDLYDNAQGFSNFAAPGADRLVIEAELIKKDLDDYNDENFVQLLSVEDGILKKISNRTEYSYIMDELAKRTYDESGDYYVKPFDLEIKESLNDYQGNNGIYNEAQQTSNGNDPAESLACISLSPGKAYVKGYSVETISNTLIDISKPRTTEDAINESIQFNFGEIIELDNVYGNLLVGFGTEAYVSLRDSRTQTVGVSSGTEIGVARVYDLKLKNSSYSGPSSKYEASLYDIQTYTILVLSSSTPTISTSSYIEGKNSGAVGYVVSTSNEVIKLHQVSGTFIRNEQITINGILDNRIIKSITDYSVDDVKQISSYNNVLSFTADTVLSKKTQISNSSSYTISAASGGISTVSTQGEFNTFIKAGDIISYTIPSINLPTYNKVKTVSSDYKTIEIVGVSSSVAGVNTSGLSTSTLNLVTDLVKITPTIANTNNGGLYSVLNHNNVSKINNNISSIIVRKSYEINITSTEFETSVLEANSNYKLEPFDEENYNLSFTDGTIVTLSSQTLIPNASTGRVTLRNLPKTGNAILTVTFKKIDCKTRKKEFSRCSTLVINKTNSGITTVNTGLQYSSIYGTRVEDTLISLNYPDVTEIVGIYESSNESDPILPTLTLNTLSTSIDNSIKGELITGKNSKAVAVLVAYTNPNIVQIVYKNNSRFQLDEDITFGESNITATVQNFTVGDRDITSRYNLDDGSRYSYLDYSRIVRIPDFTPPNKRVKIIFNHYIIDGSDDGNFVAVNSYDADRYNKDIPDVGDIKGCDIIDFRPRVSQYTSSLYSPFDFRSRNFDHSFNSSPDIIVKDESSIISYSYYLPRIDKLHLTKTGEFILTQGVPSLTPKLPNTLTDSFEVATIYLPAYVYNIKDISVVTNNYKRYTMKDISNLDSRLSNVEYYTSLSLLEVDTKNLLIVDPETKLNRFKSGFFVDNFSTYDAGETGNPIYRASIDINNRKLKPSFEENKIDLKYDEVNSSNVAISNVQNNIQIKNTVCLPYTHLVYTKNEFATRTENVNPFNVTRAWVGNLTLNPSTDTSWSEDNTQDTVKSTVNISTKISRRIDKGEISLSNIWSSWVSNWLTPPQDDKIRTKSSFSLSGRQNDINFNLSANSSTPTSTQLAVTPELSNNQITGKVSSTPATIMRTRNVEILANGLKPSTKFYAFFDGVEVTQFIVPKLIEVNMQSGTFTSGEDVVGKYGDKLIRFKLANQNHKSGPIANPETVYTTTPYNSSLSSAYSTTSTVLNVDTKSLQSITEGSYYGCIVSGMVLTGKTSGARATVKDLRIVTDSSGEFIGSLHIPDPKNKNNPKFTTGEKTFRLTTTPVYSTELLTDGSMAEASFKSMGTISQTFVLTVNKYVDPLAQSFEVTEDPGVFITKCDIYFESKDSNDTPVELQIRTMGNGVPTRNILSSVSITPDKVNVSADGTLPTTFVFEKPVYLQNNNEYALVLVANSNSYNVWISRMGEEVVNGSSTQGSKKVIVSQQPTLGSLFKSQNGSTWDASQYEDLKFTLYRAVFSTNTTAIARFTNPVLGVGNQGVTPLAVGPTNNISPITAYSKSLQITLNSNLTTPAIPGQLITQENNPAFTSVLTSSIGSVGIGSTLIIIDGGSGFAGGGSTVYSNVSLISQTGSGSGGKINLSITNGVAVAATVTVGGNGYSTGDIISINYADVNNFGKDLILSIPSTTGVITTTNSIIVDNVQGELTLGSGNLIVNGVVATGVYPTTETTMMERDGLHFKVYQKNHGMYSSNNIVSLSGIETDVPPTKLVVDLTTSASTITLEDVSNFTTFEGKTVGVGTTGYILVDEEIIGYETVNVGDNTLGSITSKRGLDGSQATLHTGGSLVYKYEFNGVSLRKINKTHTLSNVDSNVYKTPIDLDSYYININTADGVYFKETKTGGSYNILNSGTYSGPMATKNIMYSILRPNVDVLIPPFTEVSSKVRTFSATSVSGDEASFVDNGYVDMALNSDNVFSTPRAIFSRVNEVEYFNSPDKKSLYFDVVMKTNNSKVSPFINLERVNMICIMCRLDDPVVDFATDSRVNKLYDDPCSAIYISKNVYLNTQANSLKVLFDAYRHETNDIRLAYRVFRNDTTNEDQLYELFPGYGNINSRGETIDIKYSNGLPDTLVTPSGNVNEFKPYEYTVKLPYSFTGFQIKIMMTGTNQAICPEIKDLRVIATL